MDFKRFVSYIYRYDGAQKLENSGFAKVELNRDILKIRIHVRTSGSPQETCQVYLFVREDDKIAGILLGGGRVKNRKLECDFKVNGNNIMNQGVSFPQIGGILLKTESGLFYASSWDDSAIDTNNFIVYQSREEQSEAEQKKSEDMQGQDVTENPEEQNSAKQESNNSTEEILEVSAEKQTKESLQAEEDKNVQEIEETKQEEEQIEIADSKKDEKQDDNINQGIETASEEKEQIQKQESVQDGLEEEMKWDRLMQCCSTVRPFKYQDEGTFIRIEPKELWYLPKKEWVLGSNSFLLHGYYSYRYLILGKYEDGHFILGVPGRFYRQEQEMAKMFGFEQFRPVVRNNGMQGQFGYWCKEIVCPNSEYCS